MKSYNLDENVEGLILKGTDGISAYGNSLNNIITGNKGDNYISAGAGDDIINGEGGQDWILGGAGNDTISGGDGYNWFFGEDGSDTYIINSISSTNAISETASNTDFDTIKFNEQFKKSNMAIFIENDNLIIQHGYYDHTSVTNQSSAGIERLELSNGEFMTRNDINVLVQEMSAFAIEEGIQLNNAKDVQNNQELMNMVINAWQ